MKKDIAKNVKNLCESIDKEIELRDNIIRNLRKELDFKEGLIKKLLPANGFDENWNKIK